MCQGECECECAPACVQVCMRARTPRAHSYVLTCAYVRACGCAARACACACARACARAARVGVCDRSGRRFSVCAVERDARSFASTAAAHQSSNGCVGGWVCDARSFVSMAPTPTHTRTKLPAAYSTTQLFSSLTTHPPSLTFLFKGPSVFQGCCCGRPFMCVCVCVRGRARARACM